MGPVLGGSIVNDLELGRNFDPIPIAVGDENEQVVAGSMATGAPDSLKVLGREMVSPIADFGPFSSFVAVVIESLMARTEEGEGVMFVV